MIRTLISVVMCTYNGSKFIDEQIESILNQDYSNIELIILDDNSTDGTWQMLNSWRKKDLRIKIYRNEYNVGYNKNFEKAIQLANGEFIALSDQDDIWMPQKISKLVNAFQDDKISLSHNRSVRFEDGRLRLKSASLHYHFKGNDTRKLFMFNQVNGHDIMFKKKFVQKFLPIPDGMMYDWWIAVIATCYGRIASVNEYLVHHRIHSENSFFSKHSDMKKRQLDLQDVLQLFTTINVLNAEAKTFLNKFLELLVKQNKKQKAVFNFELFIFFYKNGKIIFGHKRRWFPKWNYFKNAIKYARMDFNGKGITL
ncbi:MAG: glycosyltransferase [Chitinophagaceae bacterium]